MVEYQGQRLIISKGAPEEILKICAYCETDEIITDLTNVCQAKFDQKYNALSAEGYRVLAVAYKKVKDDKTHYSIGDETEMVFLGFLSFLDPPKESAKESIRLLARDGVELKIVTGDNELVTKTTCEQLGFNIKGIVLGNEIAQLQDDALARVVEENNIFARVNPAQKDRVIKALRANGHVVGYMGDGINDAPSLKTADVGISVENAVDVAKESADLILLQPDLTVLDQGVLEGRKTFGNTMKYIMMGVSSNFGTMFSVAGASLFLSFLPMTAIQILLNNLLYDLSEATIPTDNVDEEYIEKPKRLDISYIRRFMVTMGPVSSIFDFLTFFLLSSGVQSLSSCFPNCMVRRVSCNANTCGFCVKNQKNTVLQEQTRQVFGDKQLIRRGGRVRIALHAAWRHIRVYASPCNVLFSSRRANSWLLVLG